MKRALVVIAVVTPVAGFVSTQGTAPNLPVIAPRVTELGTLFDTSSTLSMSPFLAVLSPKGNLVAYTIDEGVRTWNPRTRSSHPIANARNTFGVAWSPSGDALAFMRPDEQGSGSFLWTQRVNANTGQPVGGAQRVSLSAAATGFAAEYSPDGKQIAFVRRDQGRRSSIVVIPTAGGSEKVLASGFRLTRMQWKSNGTLYYVAADSSWLRPQVFRVPVSGGTPQLVFSGSEDSPFPLIMNDGHFTFDQLVGPNLLRMTDSTGNPVATLPLPPGTYHSDFSAEYRVAAIREEQPRGLRITEISSGNTRFLIDTTAEVGAPTWFADGKRVAVMSRIRGAVQLVTMNPDGSGRRGYPLAVEPYTARAFLQYLQADVRISPNGRYASYIGDRRASLELVDLSTGRTRTLTRAPISVSTPFWSSDSRSIRYILDGGVNVPNTTRALHEITVDGVDKVLRPLPFSEFPGGAVPLLNYNTLVAFGPQVPAVTDYKVIPLDGSRPRVLVSEPAWGGEVSPNGQVIGLRVGVRSNQAPPRREFTFISLENGARRDITLPLPVDLASFQQFHPDGKHIFVAGRESRAAPVVFHAVPVDGSAPREVARTQTRDAISAFSVSPDAKYIAYTVGATARYSFVALDYTEGVARLKSGTSNR